MISKAQQQFLDALNALMAEQHLTASFPDGPVRLLTVETLLDSPGISTVRLGFDWRPARAGERYYDVDSTATDVPLTCAGVLSSGPGSAAPAA